MEQRRAWPGTVQYQMADANRASNQKRRDRWNGHVRSRNHGDRFEMQPSRGIERQNRLHAIRRQIPDENPDGDRC